jgi:shikimate 5-dehydrogenase
MGLDWCYLAFEVPPGSLEKAVAGAAALGFRGLSVTMPHKDAAARLATRHSRQVRRLGAANTLIFEAGSIRAESCDGDGLVDDLREGAGFDPAGRVCGVIGAGGAGRAAVLALAEAGAAEIIVVNRTAARAWRSVALAPKLAHVGRPEELKGVDLVIQATPSDMVKPVAAAGRSSALSPRLRPGGSRQPGRNALAVSPNQSPLFGSAAVGHSAGRSSPEQRSELEVRQTTAAHEAKTTAQTTEPQGEVLPIVTTGEIGSVGDDPSSPPNPGPTLVAGVDPGWFGSGQLVVDLVYDPPLTPFLLEAERSGATVRNGLGMLVHQAARQISLWTGMEAPLGVMWDVVNKAWLDLPEIG